MSSAEEIVRRHAKLISCIATASVPLTTAEVRRRAGEGQLTIRTIQRDLEKLRDDGTITWREDGPGWVFGGKRIEEELDRLLSFTAIRIFEQLYDNLLPRSVQESLKNILREHREKLRQGVSFDLPEKNWLKSLVLGQGYHWLESPVISPDVRDAVEDAILNGRRLRVRMKHLPHGQWWHTGEDEWIEVSVRNFVLDLPDRPSIVVERHDLKADEFGPPLIDDIRTIWPLELVEEAQVTGKPSSLLPHGLEKLPSGAPDYVDYVLGVDPLLMEEMAGTWFVKYLTLPELGGGLIGTNLDDGWGIYRMRCPDGPAVEWQRQNQSILAFINRWMEYIEVIEPYGLRQRMRDVAIGMAERYEPSRNLPASVEERMWQESEADGASISPDSQATRWRFDPVTKRIVGLDGPLVGDF